MVGDKTANPKVEWGHRSYKRGTMAGMSIGQRKEYCLRHATGPFPRSSLLALLQQLNLEAELGEEFEGQGKKPMGLLVQGKLLDDWL